MGDAALARVRRLFTWEGVAQRLAAVYDEVLDGVPRTAPVFRPQAVANVDPEPAQGVW
jgi:hypothetical protein